MNTYYIDCNKANSSDKDNLDNSQYTTDLKESLKLTKGSQVSIQSSFINQQGITGDSIEIDEDIIENFKFMFYKTDTSDNIPDRPTSYTDPIYFNCSISSTTHPPVNPNEDTRNRLLDLSINNAPNTLSQGEINKVSLVGATEQPLILLDYVHSGGISLADIAIGEATIEIKKGVYGISQLADLVTDQINGRKSLSNRVVNPIQDRIVEGNFTTQNINSNTLKKVTIPATTFPGNLPDVSNPPNEKYMFVDVHSAESLRQERIRLNDGTGMLFNNGAGVGIGATSAMCQIFSRRVDPASDTEYRPLFNQHYVGTSNFSLDYNSDSSAFELSGLHTPYIFPSHDQHFNPMDLAGKPGVFFRRATQFVETNLTGGIVNQSSKDLLLSSISNPMSRFGGIIIHNFAFTTAVKYMTKKNIGDVEVVRNKYRFKDFFNEEKEAKEAWKKTIWSRIGFTYEQLNDTSNFERIRYYNNSTETILPGFTTNTYMDSSIIQQISSLVCDGNFPKPPATIPAPGGGPKDTIPNPVTNMLQSGTLRTFNLADANNIKGLLNIENAGLFTGSIYANSLMIPIQAAGQAITALNLPVLSKIGYYLITSDILDGYNDKVKNGDPISLLGVVAKSSLSNQDFIYSTQDIINTITNPKVLNSIRIRILKPDLTTPDLESNSSVILRIDIPQEETQGQLIIEQEEQKLQKK